MQYAIGIDIGTGSTKAVALSASGKPLASVQTQYQNTDSEKDITEQNPETIWEAFKQCLSQTIDKIKEPPAIICLSSYMHGIMAVDQNGAPLTKLITWADTRADDIAAELRQSPEAALLYRTTGTPLHSMSPLCKLIWWKRNQPELIHRAAKFISIKEYIWYKLFHEYQVDHSIASATGLMDIKKLSWSGQSLNLCGIEPSQLSTLVENSYTRNDPDSQIVNQFNIPPGTKFCIGASDGCLANLGSGAIKKNIAALTIGTSGAVRTVSPEPDYNDAAMIFNYILDKELYVCGGPVNNGGNTIQWLLSKFLNKPLDDKAYQNLFDIADRIEAGSKNLIFLPYLYGERAPIWDEKACGTYFGIREYHQAEHFIRAGIEGVCFALNKVLETLEQTAGPVTQLNISGGLLHSMVWMQILADITGKNLFMSQTEDASALGAAIMGLKSAELITSYEILEKTEGKLIVPDKDNHQRYQNLFGIFKNLYPVLQQPMHRLYELNH